MNEIGEIHAPAATSPQYPLQCRSARTSLLLQGIGNQASTLPRYESFLYGTFCGCDQWEQPQTLTSIYRKKRGRTSDGGAPTDGRQGGRQDPPPPTPHTIVLRNTTQAFADDDEVISRAEVRHGTKQKILHSACAISLRLHSFLAQTVGGFMTM